MTDNAPLPLSSRARVALSIARGIAAARGDDDLSPHLIALGLLREGENAGVATLAQAGADLRALRRDLEIALGPEGRPRASEVALPSTSGERQVLAHAVEESQRRRETFLGPHHLLLALLRDPESPVARVCAGHGVTYLAAGAALGRVLETTITDGGRGDGEPPASPPAA